MAKIPLFLLSLSLTIFSCQKEKQQFSLENHVVKQSLDLIYKDSTFKNILIDFQNQFSKVKDFTLLKQYSEDGKLSKYENEQIVSILGFADKKSMEDYFVKENLRIGLINKRYNFNTLDDSTRINIITKMYLQLKIFDNEKLSVAAPNNCEKIRKNCLVGVASVAVGMHFGCGFLDLAIVPGLICHGAAFTYQYVEGNNCNLEAEDCEKLNPTLL